MRVFLVNPASLTDERAGPYSQFMFPVPPLGIAYLAAVLREHGHDVAVEDQYASEIDAAGLTDLACRHEADVVGLSCLSPNLPRVEEAARAIREALPDAHITLGNTHAAYFAETMLDELPIDSVCLGEGEAAFAALLVRLDGGGSLDGLPGFAVRSNGRAVRGPAAEPIADLNDLPRPAWDLLRMDDYVCPPRFMMQRKMLPVQAARGCPYRCRYCAQNLFHDGIRRRDLAAVVDEIEWAHRELGITGFGCADAVFPLTEDDGVRFCELLIERGLADRIGWFTETRYDRMTPRLLDLFKRAGCRFVMYGFESASPRLIDAMGKNLDPAKAHEVMRWTKDAGLSSYGLFMIGFPTETENEAKGTIRYARRLDCDVVSFARVTPYPGTELYEEYKDTFPDDVSPWQWNNQYRPRPGERIWELPGLSHEQITDLLREAMLTYYMRPRIILRHLRMGTFTLLDLARGGLALLRDLAQRLVSRPARQAGPPGQ